MKLLRMIYESGYDKEGFKVTRLFGLKIKSRTKTSSLEYWQERAKKNGRYSVYNMGHNSDELERVDNEQIKIYRDVLKEELNGLERTALDYGCGCGRFEKMLSEMVSDKVYAADPIQELINLAPRIGKVEYKLLKKGEGLSDLNNIDIIFCSQVLDGITDDDVLLDVVNELKRLSADNALFFICENTAKVETNAFWKYRKPEDYMKLFDFVDLKIKKTFTDLNEPIVIMTGRKKSC